LYPLADFRLLIRLLPVGTANGIVVHSLATDNCAMASNGAMVSVANGSEQALQAQDVRLVVDTILTLAWSIRSDGSADLFNQRWLDYTGLSAEQARDWGWIAAVHSDDLNGLTRV
jgi:PAS domain-containing protein